MSNEIPVGTPPVPKGRHAAESGWYPDPLDLSRDRYWDGWQWSREVRARTGAPKIPLAPRAVGRSITTADGVPLASWGRRVGAVVVDYLFTGVITSTFTNDLVAPFTERATRFFDDVAAAGTLVGVEPVNVGLYLPGLLAALGIGIVIAMAYHVLLWRYLGATLGQRLFSLRVVDVDCGRQASWLVVPEQDRVGWGRLVLRALLWVVPASITPLLIFTAIDGLWPLWQPKRQAIHDLAARTQVVQISRGGLR